MQSINPDNIVLIAGLVFMMGYITINQVWLRLLILSGTILFIWYYFIAADEPLWVAIYMSLGQAAATLFGLGLIMVRRSKLAVPSSQADIYHFFDNLPPGDFRSLVKMAKRYTLNENYLATQEGFEVEKLYFVLSGTMQAKKLGERFEMPSGLFVGEVAYLNNAVAAATTTIRQGAEVLEWDVAALRRRSKSNPRFKMALEAQISSDLAAKVSRAVAPEDLRLKAG